MFTVSTSIMERSLLAYAPWHLLNTLETSAMLSVATARVRAGRCRMTTSRLSKSRLTHHWHAVLAGRQSGGPPGLWL